LYIYSSNKLFFVIILTEFTPKDKMLKKKSNRRIIREKVLQVLYAHSYNRDGIEVTAGELSEEIVDASEREFFENLVRKTIQYTGSIDDEIEAKSENWEIDRMARIDRILLRMGICEFKFFPEIPKKVTMNEIIEIAKEYSTAASGKFINGFLDKIYEELEKEGKINKRGRGLIDGSLTKPAKTND
jgi:N utilization substance protein B